jgi:hypothetical protein
VERIVNRELVVVVGGDGVCRWNGEGSEEQVSMMRGKYPRLSFMYGRAACQYLREVRT